MDPQVPTSFIPKKPLVESRGGAAGGIFTLLAILLFVASLLAAGGVFAYGKYLDSSIASKADSLKKAEGAFVPSAIRDLQRLDNRLKEAQTLIGSHVAISGLFTFLSASTLERVQFTSLTLEVADDDSGKLTMNGIADSFSTLALQSDQFSAAKALKDVIFSNITTDSTGKVVFSVTANIDPAIMSFAKQNAAAVSASAGAPAATN